MRREVQAFVQFAVNCTFKDEGCQWKWEVRHLEVIYLAEEKLISSQMCRTDNKKMAYKDSGGSPPPPPISEFGCLRFANQAVGDSCPHCRVPIQPYHVSSPNFPWDRILFVFGGSIIRRPRHRHPIRING